MFKKLQLLGFCLLVLSACNAPEETTETKNSEPVAVETVQEKKPEQAENSKIWDEKYASKPKGDALEIIKPNLKLWQPDKVELNEGVLSIVLPQDQITDKIFNSVLSSGVCGSLWVNEKYWDGVTEIQVLNRHSKQGYIFEGGERECAEIGVLPKADDYILGKTRLF